MGNRVKGRPKKKSIKAASHSGMGSKRKLSRFGKIRKKDHSGIDATFIGRSACLKKLQITLKDFRRLCILKGIYPREPRGRAPKNKKGQVYYHIKDVRAIAHEPVLEKFREMRAFMKKVRRSAGRNEKDEAARKHALAPTYTIHHLVRERYPRFVDAISDMDDALTLVYLFAALPSEAHIKTKVTNNAKALAAAWGSYCATTSSITKSFISVKGIYMEANIRGSTVRWVVPHAFTQNMPADVDYRVMLTFFEFYETLLSFILFKLYSDLGVRYPMPQSVTGGEGNGSASAILASNLRALTNALDSSSGAVSNVVTETIEKSKDETEIEVTKVSTGSKKKSRELIKSVGAALNTLNEDSDDDDDDEDDVDIAGPLKAALESMAESEERMMLPELDEDATKRRRLFAGLTLFLSREVPRGYIELVCLAYGGKVGWEGPNSPISATDPSITHHVVDRPKLPSSYNSLPKSREFVQPQWILDCANFQFLLPIAKYRVGATLPPHLSPWVDDEEEGYKPAYAEEVERLKNGEIVEADVAPASGTSDSENEGSSGNESADGDDDEEDDEETANAKKSMKDSKEEKEAHDLAKVMMSKKASRLYGRMQHGLNQKQEKVDALKKRREEIESNSKDKSAKKKRKTKR
jgi:pescadillo protein